jgi:hypothetical protein
MWELLEQEQFKAHTRHVLTPAQAVKHLVELVTLVATQIQALVVSLRVLVVHIPGNHTQPQL